MGVFIQRRKGGNRCQKTSREPQGKTVRCQYRTSKKKQDAQPVATKIKRKSKKLVKKAIKNAHLYSRAEILYFKMWLALKKQAKTAKINKDK